MISANVSQAKELIRILRTMRNQMSLYLFFICSKIYLSKYSSRLVERDREDEATSLQLHPFMGICSKMEMELNLEQSKYVKDALRLTQSFHDQE
ncbi:hypothetical protein CEXT_121661 [Caerostris extrusa]|uniref:Uncharacterized protein n=1 Tax=Caerostris extrusa TaxID=172846 RepID=A0AAV4N9N9_CAEEX|nr:hypothetical protein CEXT_121661 [Caerostris extrusa]